MEKFLHIKQEMKVQLSNDTEEIVCITQGNSNANDDVNEKKEPQNHDDTDSKSWFTDHIKKEFKSEPVSIEEYSTMIKEESSDGEDSMSIEEEESNSILDRKSKTSCSKICEVCNQKFSNRSELYNHVKSHCQTNQCPICKALFPTRRVLFMHLNVHCGWRKITCKMCKKKFTSKSKLKNHVCLQIKSYTCGICNVTIRNKRKFECHQFEHSQHVKCKICKKMTEKINLQNHMRCHSQEHKLFCGICKKEFNKSSKYNKHIKNAHGNFHCNVCNENIVGKLEFDAHMRSHVSYSCKSCEEIFSSKVDLKTHLSKHCKYCNRLFESQSLEEHLISCAQNRSYPCDICNKTFSQGNKLKQHKKIHDVNFTCPFLCEYCGKCFNTFFYLKVHLVLHSGERAFSCDKCNKSFFYKKKLKNHICKPVQS